MALAQRVSLDKLKECLLDLNAPIEKRTHCAFLLRTDASIEAALIIADSLKLRDDSPLMRHELAYILGQMGHREVSGLLAQILNDETDDVIVRHECAEAIGAIGDSDYVNILRRLSSHSAPEISETCQIAVDLIEWKQKRVSDIGLVNDSSFLSVDPAPPSDSNDSVEELKARLLDKKISLFDRYRAMFALRNRNSDESALALAEGLSDDSALFRHEIAYVLGQMQKPVTVEALSTALRNRNEHAMVRHEAAEALGAIGGEEAQRLLQQHLVDQEQIVKESCQVALNIIDFWLSNEFNE